MLPQELKRNLELSQNIYEMACEQVRERKGHFQHYADLARSIKKSMVFEQNHCLKLEIDSAVFRNSIKPSVLN